MTRRRKILISLYFFTLILFLCPLKAQSNLITELHHLQQAYPDQIQFISEEYIIWQDGTKMAIGKNSGSFPSIVEQVHKVNYPKGKPANPMTFKPISDPGRTRHIPFFQKMYGENITTVKNNLTMIYWMPAIFGEKFPIEITTINNVDKKLKLVSQELEKLVFNQPELINYLAQPGGGFNWRHIENTDRLSTHSFGISIDINTSLANYWLWDLPQPSTSSKPPEYKNAIPWEIVEVFEKHGFIWGGKWYHYDTMHFEYRPELLL